MNNINHEINLLKIMQIDTEIISDPDSYRERETNK